MNRSQTWQQVWLVLALLVAGTALIAASGADLAAPYFIYRRRKPRVAQRWLVGGMTFGLLMGYARLAQGGHFLSDILWAWGIVWLTGLILAAIMLPDQGYKRPFSYPSPR